MEITSALLGQAIQGTSFWDGLSGADLLPLLAIVIVPVLIVLIVIGFAYFDRIHRRNAEIEFKRDMVERGLSVEEIERVIAAKKPRDGK